MFLNNVDTKSEIKMAEFGCAAPSGVPEKMLLPRRLFCCCWAVTASGCDRLLPFNGTCAIVWLVAVLGCFYIFWEISKAILRPWIPPPPCSALLRGISW